jgi:non-heme chloroperoxidase
MATLTVGNENGSDIQLYFEDHGQGQPVVLIHGYPLDLHSWERQEPALLGAGYRVIAYDRRGFGASGKPSTGFDYDTFAADLHALMEHLDLNDAVLVGFSMGTGEVTRYLGRYGSGRVAKAVLIGAIPPFMVRTDDNPLGLDPAGFTGTKAAIAADRFVFLDSFFQNFNNFDELAPDRISDAAIRAGFVTASLASPYATYACVDTWQTDFRGDLDAIDVPTLVLHGTADRILPIEVTADRLPDLIADCTLVRIENGPHNIPWTFHEEVNAALLKFLAA